jgi:hypothetical protein
LVIGNDNYNHLPSLKTAGTDARNIADILGSKYGFHVTRLYNATRYDIVSELNRFREMLTEEDNLLIYYSGHAELDTKNNRGFWLPIDAEPDNSANWIPNSALVDMISVMAAKNVFLVADTSFTGTLMRSSMTLSAHVSEGDRKRYVELLARKRSRKVLTSEGLAPAFDTGGGEHSPFAQAFLDVLETNKGILSSEQLSRGVSSRTEQVPAQVGLEQKTNYAVIGYGGHEGGEFFFVPK